MGCVWRVRVCVGSGHRREALVQRRGSQTRGLESEDGIGNSAERSGPPRPDTLQHALRVLYTVFPAGIMKPEMLCTVGVLASGNPIHRAYHYQVYVPVPVPGTAVR